MAPPVVIARIDAPKETVRAERPSVVPKKKTGALTMIVQSQSCRGKKKIFDVRLKNVTKEQIYVSPTNFRLETKDGKSHSFSRETYTHPSCFWGKSLEPGEEVSGSLVFATNKPAKRLVYNDMSLMSASVGF